MLAGIHQFCSGQTATARSTGASLTVPIRKLLQGWRCRQGRIWECSESYVEHAPLRKFRGRIMILNNIFGFFWALFHAFTATSLHAEKGIDKQRKLETGFS